MAVYLDDSGSHGYDAEMEGVENTDWSRDAANKTLKMLTSLGAANTGLSLPTATALLLVEVYDVGETGSGTAGWLGYHWYQTDASQVKTDIDAFRVIVDAEYPFYKMKATEYDGAGSADVWECDDTAGFGATKDYTKSWTPSGTWKLTDTLTAPSNTLADDMYISFSDTTGDETQPSGGIYMNEIFEAETDTTTVYNTLIDENNVTNSNITLQITGAFAAGYAEGNVHGSDGYCVPDYLTERGYFVSSTDTSATVRITLPAGTWSVSAVAFRNSTGTDRVTEFTLDSTVKTIDSSTNNAGTHCATWTGLSGGTYYDLLIEIESGSNYGYLNGLKIVQTA